MLHAPIDFETNATSLTQALRNLSAETGQNLRPTPAIGQEIIYIRVHGVELADLKKRIADAAAAEWVPGKEGEILTRTTAQDKKVWGEHIAYRRRLVDEALKEAAKHVEEEFDGQKLARSLAELKPPARDDMVAGRRYYDQQKNLFSQGPLARLLDRLVLACKPDDLASVTPFSRRVFRVQPNAAQLQIDPSKYQAALAAYRKEQQEWLDEAAKVTFPEEPNGRMVSDPRAQLRHSTSFAALSLEVSRGEMTSLFNVNIEAPMEDGPDTEIVAQNSYADPGRKFLNSISDPPASNRDDPEVKLSADSKEFMDAFLAAFGGSESTKLSARMRALMTGMEVNDPLSWIVGDVLDTYADKNDLDVVASLPDATLSYALLMGRNGPIKLNSAIKGLVDSGAVRIAREGSWVSIVPPDRYEALLEFTPRKAADDLIKATLKLNRLDIQSYAKYAFESKRLNRGGFGDWFLALIDRTLLGASDRTDWKALQLYGSLDEVQQRDLEAGKTFAYNGLSEAQRRLVDRIVYSGRMEGEVAPQRVSFRGIDPTDSFPLGVPPTCAFSAKVQSTPVIVAYTKSEEGVVRPSRSLNAWTLVTVEQEVVGSPAMMARYGVANLVGYAMGADKVINMRIAVSNAARVNLMITIPEYDMSAQPKPWEQLPEATRKEVQTALQQYKSQKSGGGGNIIPPN